MENVNRPKETEKLDVIDDACTKEHRFEKETGQRVYDEGDGYNYESNIKTSYVFREHNLLSFSTYINRYVASTYYFYQRVHPSGALSI